MIIEVAEIKQDHEKHVRLGIRKFPILIMIEIQHLELLGVITIVGILMENKKLFGVIQQIQILRGSYVIQ